MLWLIREYLFAAINQAVGTLYQHGAHKSDSALVILSDLHNQSCFRVEQIPA